jgi:hypothetical protein
MRGQATQILEDAGSCEALRLPSPQEGGGGEAAGWGQSGRPQRLCAELRTDPLWRFAPSPPGERFPARAFQSNQDWSNGYNERLETCPPHSAPAAGGHRAGGGGRRPLPLSFYSSFTPFRLTKPETFWVFIGTRNYWNLLTDWDFWIAFGRTVLLLTVALNLEMLLGLALAMLVEKATRGQRLLRTLMMFPMCSRRSWSASSSSSCSTTISAW